VIDSGEYGLPQVEKLADIPTEIGKTAKAQAKLATTDFFSQMLGLDLSSKKAEHPKAEKSLGLKGQLGEFVLFDSKSTTTIASFEKKPEKAHKQESHGAIDYAGEILNTGKSHKELREVSEQVQQIMVELKKLISSSRVLQMEFAEVAVEQAPVNVGKYHVNFFDWMLSVIRIARQKVEDSGAWLNTIQAKGSKKKLGYWGMMKKHGTSFGLSNERAIATQAG
jgi:hypothetical protein